MVSEIVMPKAGLTMVEGTIMEWLAAEGAQVKKGDAIMEYENEKNTIKCEALADGILHIAAKVGDTIPIGERIGDLADTQAEYQALLKAAAPATPASAQAANAMPKPAPKAVKPAPKAVKSAPAPAVRNTAPAAPAAKAVAPQPGGAAVQAVVVGGGPGGYVAAIRAAQLGASVTLVEREHVGGTCLNIGCVPTKALLHSAELLDELKTRGTELGLTRTEAVGLDFGRLMAHKNDVCQKLTGGVSSLLRMNKVKVISGEASFTGPGKLSVKTADGKSETLTPDKIILATGSANAQPPIPGIDNPHCIDSTGALSLSELPKRMVVVGGGVIGLELACAYAAFGTKITVVEALDHMLPMLDEDLTRIGAEHMKKMGMEFHLQTRVLAIEPHAKDGVQVKVRLPDGKEGYFQADKVLVATGRRPNTASLHLENGGIRSEKGAILVNDRMETSAEGVYAIGDCVKGYAQLAHTASAMGEVAAENMMGIPAIYDEKTNPTCVYMEPEAASVGLTEAQCRERGIPYKVGRFPMSANGKALILNGGEGLVKIIAGEKYGEILGMHIIGPRATDLIAEGALAIGVEATLDELIATIHSHPTVTETMREAALHAEKRAIHIKN